MSAARTAQILLAVAAFGVAVGAGADQELLYELPEAGSYELPVIDHVAQRQLLDADGGRAELLRRGADGCTIVSFVYLSCTDATGCPLSLAQLQRLDRELAARPELAERVRLATVSFDPSRDGPEQMANLRMHMAPRADWRFFTTKDEDELRPVLEDFGQDVVPLVTDAGRRTGLMIHVTKVFLVDAEGRVRNIYSTGFLDHRVVMRDIETLLQGDAER